MVKMTISQALRRVSKLKGQMAEWDARARAASTTVKGKEPEFAFKESVEKLDLLREEVVGLTEAVAVANATNSVEFEKGKVTLAGAIRRLQELKSRIALYKGIVIRNEKVEETEWDADPADYSKRVPNKKVTEFVASISEKDRDAAVKTMQDKFEALNDALESANHRVTIELHGAADR